jgi:hypothetical protein
MTDKSPAINALVIGSCGIAMLGGAQMQAAPAVQNSPDALPGKGLTKHDFLYRAKRDMCERLHTMFIVRAGKIAWQYSMPLRPTPEDQRSWQPI